MLKWLRQKAMRKVSGNCHQEAELFYRMVLGCDRDSLQDLAWRVAALRTNIVYKAVEFERPPPACLLRSCEPTDEEAMFAALYLNRLVRGFQQQGMLEAAAAASALLHTYRAYLHPEVRYLGRKIWGLLLNGAVGLEARRDAILLAMATDMDAADARIWVERVIAMAQQVPGGMEPEGEL